MKRYNDPFKNPQKVIASHTRSDKMTDNYKEDLKYLVVVE